ncbi:hypothetical protein DPMN_186320 [Dreissena polymorpha]|uniref:Uncharacterized protein n=1 Tax=Dreissena polymorpha TaxID=45954 RepID=A0A9D4I6F4_DREPO|nr:hypothetical protein DPMN_186320 [Dreissena polymorpha]
MWTDRERQHDSTHRNLTVLLWATAVMGSDLVIYDINSQANCTHVDSRSPRRDCRWAEGLGMADQIIEGGKIIAYKIKWFNGIWSNWFVSGINDLDIKFNLGPSGRCPAMKANTMRRFWSYFYDHNHQYIICKPK